MAYIWQNPQFPEFTYDKDVIMQLVSDIRIKQGYLIGKMGSIDINDNLNTILNTVVEDIIKSNEIEGLSLNVEQVRSSVAQKLGLDVGYDGYIDRSIQGTVDMTFDAIQNFDKPLTKEKLFAWHSAMFPTGTSGLSKILTGRFRDDANGPMQVVSGAIGHEKVHYQAPPAELLDDETAKLLEYINNDNGTNILVKAGVVHLWFVILHPFEDGNGRIARALSDMLIAKSENSSNRYYSLSSEINSHRKDYYKSLEITQKSELDITDWLVWFLTTLSNAISSAENLYRDILKKSEFWKTYRGVEFSPRQTKVLAKLLDGFDGNLTTSKWAKICNCSQDTATLDIKDLISKGILEKVGDGRSTHYLLK